MFPHLFIHWLTAKRASAFRSTIVLYPVAIALVWVPSVVLGVLGTVDFPDLKGAAANSILIRLIELHAPTLLAGLLAAGVVSSVMNSLDSQSLAIGSMFTQDIVRHYGLHDRMSEKQQVFYGRLFVAVVLLFSYGLSLTSHRSIFRVGVWAFSGFAALLPIVIAALYWKRSTKEGAIACVLTVVVSWAYFYYHAGDLDNYTVGGTGIMPVAVMLFASSLVLVVVSLLTKAPEPAVLDKFFPSAAKSTKLERMAT
jgi:SSS family solute:Na+ symporter